MPFLHISTSHLELLNCIFFIGNCLRAIFFFFQKALFPSLGSRVIDTLSSFAFRVDLLTALSLNPCSFVNSFLEGMPSRLRWNNHQSARPASRYDSEQMVAKNFKLKEVQQSKTTKDRIKGNWNICHVTFAFCILLYQWRNTVINHCQILTLWCFTKCCPS